MREVNVVRNLTIKKRYQTYNLIGHQKMITAIDAKDGFIVSGSNDNLVKVWDSNKKKAYTFDKHTNWIS